jgi:hypothetical protein
MSVIRGTGQPDGLSEMPGKDGASWVSEVLRRAAEAEGRLAIVGTLAAADLWRIRRGTERRAAARDKRTHEAVSCELERRGLLDPPVWCGPLVSHAATDSEVPRCA